MTSQQKLSNHVALVTGVGRKQGIGAAICRALAMNGAKVFFTYWHQYDAQLFPDKDQIDPPVFSAELNEYGVKTAYAEVDLSSLGSASQLYNTVKQQLGLPTVLINNACYDVEVPFVDINEKSLDKHYKVNVRATVMLCKEFVKNGRPGTIINMTSGQSLGPMGETKIPYTITKSSVEMLTKQLAPELKAKGIMITALDPGPTDTGWMPEELKTHIIRESKSGRVNMPDDVAVLIVELLGDERYSGFVVHAER